MRETLHRNDTYGDLTEDQHAALVEHAERCVWCGWLATVDPAGHARVHGHDPVVLRNGRRHRWHARLYCWEAE